MDKAIHQVCKQRGEQYQEIGLVRQRSKQIILARFGEFLEAVCLYLDGTQ